MKYLIVFIVLSLNLVQAQQTKYLDFKSAKAHIRFEDLLQNEVIGLIDYEIEILKDVDSIYLDARNFYDIDFVLLDSTQKSLVEYHYQGVNDTVYNGKHLVIKYPFKAKANHTIQLKWGVKPKKAMYFIDWEYDNGNKQIWTQGQGKYTSNWLPSIDDMNDKIIFDLSIEFLKDYKVIANGKLKEKEFKNSTITWHYNMQQPMCSYLIALAIGKYKKQISYSKSGIPLEMYYYPQDSLKLEPTYRYTKRIFDFLEDEIAVKYPWQNYKQIPVKDFMYAGMENTGTTIFSDSFVIDSTAFVDKNYVNVNAHELAHQWFGNLVTERSGTHHWLHEGFATYYALLAEKEIFGDAYYYSELYKYAMELLDQDKEGLSTCLIDPKSSSTTFYKKGAWALVILRNLVGDKDFRKAIKNFLNIYQYKNAGVYDFIAEVKKVTNKDVTTFVEKWIESETLYSDDMMQFLKLSSKDFRRFLALDCNEDKEKCMSFIKRSKNSFLKGQVVRLLKSNVNSSLLNTKDLLVRRALAKYLNPIPKDLKQKYELFLDSDSYLIKEIALTNLWKSFPESRFEYLKKTEKDQGFNDKNIRTLWLTLALLTKDFLAEEHQAFYLELVNYTNPKYNFEIRRNAFQYLNYLQACNTDCINNLKQAATHHVWYFSKFAKQLLKSLDSN